MKFTIKQYKNYNKLKTFLYLLPRQKILKFKRSKWQFLKNKLLLFSALNEVNLDKEKDKEEKNIIIVKKRVLPFVNNLYFTSSIRDQKFKKFYKNSVLLKKSLTVFFNYKLVISDFKKLIKSHSNYNDLLWLNILIKPLYFLEILLCKLGLYKTIFEIKQSLINQEILVNGKSVTNNMIVKKGDFISFKKFQFHLKFNIPVLLQSILEIDFYNNNIIILLDYFEFNLKSLPLIYPERLDINQFIDYIKSK